MEEIPKAPLETKDKADQVKLRAKKHAYFSTLVVSEDGGPVLGNGSLLNK